MIQLSYQPALDPFHTIFRILRLSPQMNAPEFDKARIADFYLLFPNRVDKVRLKPRDQRYKRLSSKYSNRAGYSILPSDRILFRTMASVYTAAAQTLVGEGYFDDEAFRRGLMIVKPHELSSRLREMIALTNDEESDVLELTNLILNDYELLGGNGLKARTGLLEHRNDAV